MIRFDLVGILVLVAATVDAQVSTTSTQATTTYINTDPTSTTTPGCPAGNLAPVFSGPIISADEREFYFKCEVDFGTDGYSAALVYLIDFIIDGVADLTLLSTTEAAVTDVKKYANLPDVKLRGNLGKTVKCRLRVLLADAVCNIWTSQDDYLPRVYIDPTSLPITLPVDTELEVPVMSSIPILCDQTSDDCWLEFHMYNNYVASGTECVLQVHPQSYVNHPDHSVTTTSKILLRAVDDDFAKADPFVTMVEFTDFYLVQGSKYYLGSSYFSSQSSIFTGYQLSSLQVSIVGDTMPARMCSSSGDPHISTFDRQYYHAFGLGDHIYMRSTDPDLSFEVQVRHWACLGVFWNVACNCAVAVREGNMILGIDVCGSSRFQIRLFFIRYLRDGTDGAYIERMNGYRWAIVMPSGLRVEVTLHLSLHLGQYWFVWGLGLYIYAPPKFMGKTEGLCGNYDNDPSNDLIPYQGSSIIDSWWSYPFFFVYSYRVYPFDSIFNGQLRCAQVPPSRPYCKCVRSQLWWLFGLSHTECSGLSDRVFTWRTPYLCQAVSSGRRKRQAEEPPVFENTPSDDVLLDADIFSEANATEGEALEYDWTSPGPDGEARDYTEADVILACEDAIQAAPGYLNCSGSVDTESLNEECKIDVYLSDDLGPIAEKVTKFQLSCTANKTAAIVLEEDTDEAVAMAFAEVEEVANATCPQNCNGNGECVNQQCQCDSDWAGEACELSADAVPEFDNLTRTFCAKPDNVCEDVMLIDGRGIINSDQLTCRVVGKNIVEETVATVDMMTSATYLSMSSVKCKLPQWDDFVRNTSQTTFSALEFAVSVSNDGVSFGAELNLVVYDSACVECDETMAADAEACGVKIGTCLIKGFCYADGTKRPEYPECGVCDPGQGQLDWSAGTSTGPRVTNLVLDSAFRVDTDTPFSIQWSDPDGDVITAAMATQSEAFATHDVDGSGGTFQWAPAFVGRSPLEINLTDGGNYLTLHVEILVVSCETCSCNFAMMSAYVKP